MSGSSSDSSSDSSLIPHPSRSEAETPTSRGALTSFLFAIPIAILGGLIGLGGAEFRLPVLVGVLRYDARRAVPLNLAVSLVTIVTSIAVRGGRISIDALAPLFPAMGAMIAGAMITAFLGASIATKLSKEKLEGTIVWLLLAIGAALVVEGFLPERIPALLPESVGVWIVAGVLFGLAIGMVSSLLGVAGGEMIIPTLVFAYGADIKLAGTASLLISLPTILVGIGRYASRGAFVDREPLKRTVAPMAIGSIIGALIGGALVGVVPPSVLKVGLGIVLVVSAVKMFRKS